MLSLDSFNCLPIVISVLDHKADIMVLRSSVSLMSSSSYSPACLKTQKKNYRNNILLK